MLPLERGATGRKRGVIAIPAAWGARPGRSTPLAGGRRCVTAPAAFAKGGGAGASPEPNPLNQSTDLKGGGDSDVTSLPGKEVE